MTLQEIQNQALQLPVGDRLGIQTWQPLCLGMDTRPIQRKEAQRSNDHQTLQYLQVC